jgi:pimeloyl-ACP methyl ester carboxylesterase
MDLRFTAAGKKIEVAWHGPGPEHAPTLVLLHEGLGSVAMWKEFPQRLAERTGYGVLAYSRPGYGNSDPVALPRPLTYMHDEARESLPAVLDRAGVRKAILIGHSDGASIAAIYAGSCQDFRVRGLVLIAPHFFVEDISVRSIAAAKDAYETGDLRARLVKYHRDVDVAFRGWNRAWLDPDFRHWRIDEYLAYIRVPILIVQGERDQYATTKQIDVALAECTCPVEVALLPGIRHAPHREAPQATLQAASGFANRLLRDHHEADLIAPATRAPG